VLPALFVSLVLLMAASKKEKKEEAFLGRPALEAGTEQTLSNPFLSFDIYGPNKKKIILNFLEDKNTILQCHRDLRKPSLSLLRSLWSGRG
jgi:hypothetical protein